MEVNPKNHPLSQLEFDVIIGADGRRNTLPGETPTPETHLNAASVKCLTHKWGGRGKEGGTYTRIRDQNRNPAGNYTG